jgi:hypothetical protein
MKPQVIAFATACHSELARNLKLLVGQIPEIPRQARNDKSTIFCGIFQMRSPWMNPFLVLIGCEVPRTIR